MSLYFWKKDRTPRAASSLRRRRRSQSLRSIRVLERCEDRTLMATALGVTGGSTLIRFDTASPGTINASTPITGLVTGDSIVGLDFRPATGVLYGLGGASRLYTIDPSTGIAAQVGTDGAFTLNGTAFGFNFNPVPDRIRVTSDADQNLRLNPNNGALAATDGALAYATGDPNAGANPNVVASSYTNSFGGSTTTTLYDIDSNLDTLVIQNPPNSGTLNTVVGAGLGINVQNVAGFDIQPLPGGGNAAFAALTTDGVSSSLYTIDLTTGSATLVGTTPIGGTTPLLIRALAVAPFGAFQFSSATYSVGESGPVANITVNRVLGSEGVATVRFTTSDGSAKAPADYTSVDQVLIFAPGVTSQVVQIPIVDDALPELSETVNLTLTAATGGATLGTPSSGVLTIVDNDTPVAVNDSYSTPKGSTLTVPAPGVLANDTDPHGDPLSVLLVSNPTHGRLSFNTNGSFTYTPDARYTGPDSFTYRAFDGLLASNLATVSLTVTASSKPIVTNDYDGDSKSDVAVYLPASGTFAIGFSSGIPNQITPFGLAGAGQSIAVSGDFDGDGKADLAVYLPSLTLLAYRPSGGGPDVFNYFGIAGAGQTIPAPGDYFGTGRTDVAGYLPVNGSFALRNPAGGPDTYIPFGIAGAGQSIPDPGDFNGDGKTDLAVYLPSLGAFGIRPSGGGADQIIPFGLAGAGRSIPVSGDFDGDGKTDLAVYLPSLASLAYRPSGGGPDVFNYFGIAGPGQTLPAPGDYIGLGRAQVAAYLPAGNSFAIRPGTGAPDSVFEFGVAGTGQTVPVTVVDLALSQVSSRVSAASIPIPDPAPIADFLTVPTLSTSKKKAQG